MIAEVLAVIDKPFLDRLLDTGRPNSELRRTVDYVFAQVEAVEVV